jgi:hypothetical protein
MAGTEVLAFILVIALFLIYVLVLYAIIRAGTKGTFGWIAVVAAGLIGLLLIIYLIANIANIVPADWAQIILTLGLVAVTSMYAWSTQKQAKASVEMAEEMREQRYDTVRPVIIQKAIHEDEKKVRAIEDPLAPNYFSHFEIYNAGNGPAIELEISLRDRLDREGTGLESHRKTFLLAGDTLELHPFTVVSLDESRIYYLACEYQSLLSRSSKTWHQSLLPFKPVKSSKEGKIYVKAGELEFKEVTEKERIDAFGSRSKPK